MQFFVFMLLKLLIFMNISIIWGVTKWKFCTLMLFFSTLFSISPSSPGIGQREKIRNYNYIRVSHIKYLIHIFHPILKIWKNQNTIEFLSKLLQYKWKQINSLCKTFKLRKQKVRILNFILKTIFLLKKGNKCTFEFTLFPTMQDHYTFGP